MLTAGLYRVLRMQSGIERLAKLEENQMQHNGSESLG